MRGSLVALHSQPRKDHEQRIFPGETSMMKSFLVAVALGTAALGAMHGAQAQQRAICYNCPPQWADWGSQLKAIQYTARARSSLKTPNPA